MRHETLREIQGLLTTPRIADCYDPCAEATITEGDCLDTLKALPGGEARLIITDPSFPPQKSLDIL